MHEYDPGILISVDGGGSVQRGPGWTSVAEGIDCMYRDVPGTGHEVFGSHVAVALCMRGPEVVDRLRTEELGRLLDQKPTIIGEQRDAICRGAAFVIAAWGVDESHGGGKI